MEAATMKTVNFLAASTTPRLAAPASLNPQCSSIKPNSLPLYTQNLTSRTCLPSLTRCSTKSDTTDPDSTVGINPNSITPNPSTPIPNEPLTSSLTPPSSSSTGLVFDLGPANAWDSMEIGSPVVKRFLSDEEERWYMWYYGSCSENPGSDSIGLAVSSNGIHWERGQGSVSSSGDVGLVMNCGKDWWAFDTRSIRPGEVVIMSSNKIRASSAVYWLYYAGYSYEKVDFEDHFMDSNLLNPERICLDDEKSENGRIGKVCKSLPGLAISQDGRHWARIEGEHHSGAQFDVGSERDWDSLFIASPQVVFHENGDLRMYYHSFDVENGQFGIGIARSRDGLKWVKLGKIMGEGKSGSFDENGVVNARVVRNRRDGNYVMVYEGVGGDGRRSIGVAESPEGLKDWRRCQDEAVLKPSVAGWDDMGVGSPCLVQMDGDANEWRLYYRGVGKEGRNGIGMAVSQGSDFSSFGRWRGFHL